MKANIPGNVVNTAPKVDVPQGATTKVTPNIKPNLDTNNARGVEEANAARGLNDLKGGEALRNIPGAPTPGQNVNPDLGLGNHDTPMDTSGLPGHDTGPGKGPAGSEYLPELPNNQDKSALGGAPTGAASSPRDIMGGAASTDPKALVVTDKETTEERGPNGTIISTTTITYANGSRRLVQENRDRGGENELNYRRIITTDAEGNVTLDRWRGRHPRERGRGPLDPSWNPDPESGDADGAWARWMAKWSGRRPDLKMKRSIDQVNPGPDGATPNPQAPRLTLPEDQLVINPSPENAGGQSRELSAEQRKGLEDQLREKVKGPGGDPGTPEGP